MKIEFDNYNVFDVELSELIYDDYYFIVEPFEQEILVYFNFPDSTCVTSLITRNQVDLYIRDTDHKVGKLIQN